MEMTDFQIGDKVRCINANNQGALTEGKEYEVANVRELDSITVINDVGEELLYFPERFELVEGSRKIPYGEIRVGDKIRSTYSYTDESMAINETREGVVTLIEEDFVYADSRLLAVTGSHTTYELLERPVPKVPTKYLSVVQHKRFPELFVLVRVREGNNNFQWLGQTEPYDARRWYQDRDVQELLATGDWEVITNEDH